MSLVEKVNENFVVIDYTNHAGQRAIRKVMPHLYVGSFRFGATEWHSEPQYLLDAYDIDKGAMRTFAMKDIHGWAPKDSASGRAMDSVFKQLQRSIEKNGRMLERIRKLQTVVAGIDDSEPAKGELDEALRRLVACSRAINAILKDEEPTWPAASIK